MHNANIFINKLLNFLHKTKDRAKISFIKYFPTNSENFFLLTRKKPKFQALKYNAFKTLDENQSHAILLIETAYDVRENAAYQRHSSYYNKHHTKHPPHNEPIVCFQH